MGSDTHNALAQCIILSFRGYKSRQTSATPHTSSRLQVFLSIQPSFYMHYCVPKGDFVVHFILLHRVAERRFRRVVYSLVWVSVISMWFRGTETPTSLIICPQFLSLAVCAVVALLIGLFGLLPSWSAFFLPPHYRVLACLSIIKLHRREYSLHISQIFRRHVFSRCSSLFDELSDGLNNGRISFVVWEPPVHAVSISEQICHLRSECVWIYVSV